MIIIIIDIIIIIIIFAKVLLPAGILQLAKL